MQWVVNSIGLNVCFVILDITEGMYRSSSSFFLRSDRDMYSAFRTATSPYPSSP